MGYTVRAIIFAFCVLILPAAAQDAAPYPSKPITVVNPGSSGGSVELQVRILADGFRERTGQSLIVTNRPGAMGSTGATFVYRAPPDGYTLLASPNPPMVFNQLTRKSLSYEATKLTPITLLGVQPLVMGARGGRKQDRERIDVWVASLILTGAVIPENATPGAASRSPSSALRAPSPRKKRGEGRVAPLLLTTGEMMR